VALKDTITAQLKEAMKAKDQVRLDTLRSALSAFSYKKIEAGHELADDEQVAVVRKLIKQRTDSITEYTKGNRPELAAKEEQEREILTALLPPQKSTEEIRAVVRAAIEALPPEGRNQGAAMKTVMPALKGEADGGVIRTLVMEELKALGA